MKSTNHTPSPWLRSKSGNTFQIVAGKDMNEEPSTLVANIPPIGYNCDYEPCDETKANAHLIASAPELLSALKSIKEWLEEPIDYQNLPQQIAWANGVAKVAIAKAEGNK